MKYLTITVPCYNSEQYLRRCLDSLVIGGDEIEIIVVDDGSTDKTGEIAEEYANRFPDIVTVIHKENGGHGSGVNTGLLHAHGEFFKVVDSDDWLEEEAFKKLIKKLKDICHGTTPCPDLIVCNYTYNHLDEGKQKCMRYRNVFPKEKISTWEDIKGFLPSQYLIMHALIYRTMILRTSNVILPEHTFYVDNIFAYYPLPFVEKLLYLDLDLYQYYLGRKDQSVNEKVMIERIEQQIKVTKIVAECVDLKEVKKKHPKLAQYMCRNISIMMAISSIHLLLAQEETARQRHKLLWEEMKQKDRHLYYRLRFTTLSGLTNLPGNLGKKLAVDGYRAAKKIYKFQ